MYKTFEDSLDFESIRQLRLRFFKGLESAHSLHETLPLDIATKCNINDQKDFVLVFLLQMNVHSNNTS